MTRQEIETENNKLKNQCMFQGRILSAILRKHGGQVNINFKDFDASILTMTVSKNQETESITIKTKEVNHE